MTSLCRNTPELHLHIPTVEMLIEIICVYVVNLLIVLPVCGCTDMCVNADIRLRMGMLVYLNDCHYSTTSVF